MLHHHIISEKEVEQFKKLAEKEGIRYDTNEEYREAAQNMYDFAGLMLDMAMEDQARKRRLESEPNGYSMAGQGRNCSLCQQTVANVDGWYDKWGFKCINCQDAINKKRIPASLCGDWDHKKYMTESTLAWKSGLHTQTIRKLVRNGKIKVRQIPNGPFLVLRKDNQELENIIQQELKSKD